MATSSYSFVVVSLVVLLISPSALTSTTFIDAICKHVNLLTGKAFCVQTLTTYPQAASATNTFQAAQAALNLGISYAEKSAGFARRAATNNPTLKKQFRACQDAFMSIKASLHSAVLELKESPDTANYDVMVCSDQTEMVKKLVGKNTDKDSKTIVNMALMMDKLQGIAVGATVAVGG